MSARPGRAQAKNVRATALREIKALADPEVAEGMAAYMKSEMPCLGVKKKPRVSVERKLKKEFPPSTREEYEENVRALWSIPFREGKYLAIAYARSFKAFIVPASIPLYRELIVDGAWWDFVDDIASNLVGHCLREGRAEVAPLMREWIDDDDEWIRRTAILSQLKHQERTDEKMLFDFCRRRMHEKSFWIRKAIGWALRSYSYTAPEAVQAFVDENASELSGLSKREALKVIGRSAH